MPTRWSALTRSRNSSTAAVGPVVLAYAGVRGEERHGLVAPVVDQAGRRGQAVEREDRQQLDGGDPELDEIRDPVDEACVRAAPGGRHAGAGVGGEARQVRLVDDRLAPGVAERTVALPVVRAGVDHHALHGGRVVGRGRPIRAGGSRSASRLPGRMDPAAAWSRRSAAPRRDPMVRRRRTRRAGRPRSRARGRASSRRSGRCADRGGSPGSGTMSSTPPKRSRSRPVARRA